MNLLRLADVDVRGKRVFIRADLNVPQDDAGRITDDTRIRASVPAIQDALLRGGAVMVTSHLGRPVEGKLTDADSLAPIAARLGELLEPRGPPDSRLGRTAARGTASSPPATSSCSRTAASTRARKRTVTNSRSRWRISAMSTATTRSARRIARKRRRTPWRVTRRSHAPARCSPRSSMRSAARSGIRSVRWLRSSPARRCRRSSRSCGRSLAKVDALIVGGGIANTFMLAAGGRIGKSLAEADLVGEARAILDEFPGKVPVPVDVVCAKAFAADAAPAIKAIDDVADDDLILDIGPQTVASFERVIAGAGTIVWNGPVGVFEFDAFAAGTRAIAKRHCARAGVLDRGRWRYGGGHRKVRRGRSDRVHLDRRRRVPRVSRRQDAARRRGAGGTRKRRTFASLMPVKSRTIVLRGC